MTILSTVQDAALLLGLERPTSLVGSTDRDAQELLSYAHEVARMIADTHDWRRITALHTITGDGATIAHPLPSDYLRMPKDARLWSSDTEFPLVRLINADESLEHQIRSYDLVPSTWFLIGNTIEIRPAESNGQTVKFYYITTQISDAGTSTFGADTESFVLGERLLKLGLAWYWRSSKQQPAESALVQFRDAVERAIAEDGGAQIVRVGRRMPRLGASIAYPRFITP